MKSLTIVSQLVIAILLSSVSYSQVALKKNDRVVFLGDSITAAGVRPSGYITLASQAIVKAHPDLNIELIGAGIGGHKVPNCQQRLDKDVLQKKPTIVFIYIGINDVWHWSHPRVVKRGGKGTTPEDFESGLREMIAKINKAGARVILCTPTVIGEKHDGTNPDDKRLDQYSDISRKIAKDTQSQLLDLRKLFIGRLKKHNPKNLAEGIFTSDGVHMNEKGNRFLSQLVLKALKVTAQKKGENKKAPKTKKIAPTHANVPYDTHKRTVLDFWQAKGEGPRPVMVYIHGGGWSQGDKSRHQGIEKFLAKGISVAAINYRLLNDQITLPTPVHDAARAIQFLRSKSADWNIDKNKFVLTGGSAGGCTSVWLATHDDLAKPDSKDPVERESTRVQGIAVRGAQTAIDPKLIEPWIGENVYHSMIYLSVGEKSIKDALKNYDQHQRQYKEFSGYYHLSKDDPPMYLGYGENLAVPATSIGHGIHHGMFGLKFQEKSKVVGHNKVYVATGRNITGPEGVTKKPSLDEFVFNLLLGE